MRLGLAFRAIIRSIPGGGDKLLSDLDQLVASIKAGWYVEHNGDGTHSDITADSVTADSLALTTPLPVTSGGTGLASGTSGGVLGFTASTTLASSVALTANALVLGGGAGATPTPMGSLGTTTTVLHGNAAGAPTFGAVALGTDVSGDLPFANLTQGAALSVLGVTGNATADHASIAAGSDSQVLRRAGTAVAFGAVDLAAAAAVTGDLPFANLTQGAALSVLGVAGNATADHASIAAASDSQVLRRSGTALAFGAVDLAAAAAITGTLPNANLPAAISVTSVTASAMIQGTTGVLFGASPDRIGVRTTAGVVSFDAGDDFPQGFNFQYGGTVNTAAQIHASGGVSLGNGTDPGAGKVSATDFSCDAITNDTGLAAGVYTPTRSAEANLDASVTPTEAQYLRVGNTVHVSGRVTGVDPTAAGAASFELSLPIASNLGAVEDLAGVAFSAGIAGQGAEITGSVANNTAVLSWVAVDVTSQSWSYTFTYQVI